MTLNPASMNIAKRLPPTRRRIVMRAYLLLVSILAGATPVAAQRSTVFVAAAGGGGSYYCIVSRCDTGGLLGASVGVMTSRAIGAEAGVRWHFCMDCSRFVIGEAAVQVRYPGLRIQPFVAGGLSYASDPEFMGRHIGLLAGAGASVSLTQRWGVRIDIRGRQVGRGDRMGEAMLLLTHRVGRSGT